VHTPAELIRLRFSGVRFATLFATAIGSYHPNAGTVAAQLPAVKIDCTLFVFFNRTIGQLSMSLIGSPTYFLTTPAAVTAVFG
jgi:hypothetical protein